MGIFIGGNFHRSQFSWLQFFRGQFSGGQISLSLDISDAFTSKLNVSSYVIFQWSGSFA